MIDTRSEFSANILLTQHTNTVSIGSTFTKPAPRRMKQVKPSCKLAIVMKRIYNLLSR